MPELKLLIFDLDGTLIDSLDDLTDAANHMRMSFGRPPLTRTEVRKLIGQGAKRLVERAMPGASEKETGLAIECFLSYNDAHIADKTKFFPGVAESLILLQDFGLNLAVISNKNVLLCRKVLHTLHAEQFFSTVIGADSLPFRKPSPEPILHLVRQYGLDPSDAAIVGDSINDIAAGNAAGVATIGCTYGYGEIAELRDASWRIDSFPELLDLPIFGNFFSKS